MATLAGILSMFVDSSAVVMPTLAPVIIAICAASPEFSLPVLLVAMVIGTTAGGNSPLSTGGSLMMLFVRDEERTSVFLQIWRNAFGLIVVGVLVVCVMYMSV